MTGIDSAQPRLLLVLDVDGTISRIYSKGELHAHRHEQGWYQWLPLDEPVIDALDEQARRPGVDVAWLTSWARDQEDVDWLVDGDRLRGRLRGACVPWVGWPARGWRTRSFMTYLKNTRPASVIWADDRAPRHAGERISEALSIPHLVLKPDVHVGLTLDDVHRVRTFIDEQLA